MSDVKQVVREFVVENFLYGDDDELSDDTSFLENGIIDSTGVLELVEFIEDTFDLDIDNADLVPENLDSLEKVTAYIVSKTG